MGRKTALALLALVSAPAWAQTVHPGAPAPELRPGTWLKGGISKGLVPGKMYVVEFWATWCGPCKTSIPHLTELAHKYKGQIEFIGVSSYERGKPVAEIGKFVEEMGDSMDYHVVTDTDDWMAKNWMTPAKQNGIPTAFLVKDGVVQWIGHPMQLDGPLDQLVTGTLDVEAQKNEFMAKVAKSEKDAAVAKEFKAKLDAATLAYKGGDKTVAIASFDALAKENPERVLQIASAKLSLYADDDMPAAEALIKQIASGDSDDWRFLASYAMGTLKATTEQGKSLGAKALAAAMEAAADNDILVCYYAGLYYKDSGQKAEALKCIDRALALQDSSEFKGNKGLTEALTKLRAELAG